MKEILPDADRPPIATGVYIDGTEVVVWTCGNTKTKTHRPHPVAAEDDVAIPACFTEHNRFKDADDVTFRFEQTSIADEWREPCKVCFPDHYEEVDREDGRSNPGPIDARKLRHQIHGDD